MLYFKFVTEYSAIVSGGVGLGPGQVEILNNGIGYAVDDTIR